MKLKSIMRIIIESIKGVIESIRKNIVRNLEKKLLVIMEGSVLVVGKKLLSFFVLTILKEGEVKNEKRKGMVMVFIYGLKRMITQLMSEFFAIIVTWQLDFMGIALMKIKNKGGFNVRRFKRKDGATQR
jgi:uncharacterized protein YbcI